MNDIAIIRVDRSDDCECSNHPTTLGPDTMDNGCLVCQFPDPDVISIYSAKLDDCPPSRILELFLENLQY